MSWTFVISTFIATFCCIYFVCIDAKSENKPNVQLPLDKDSPTDIASVSKFIKDFQKKIDDSSLSSDKYDINFLKDYTSEYAQTGEEVLEDENYNKAPSSENVTSLVKCNTKDTTTSVELVNSTRLVEVLMGDPNVTSRTQEARCVILLFYGRSCPFSCMAAPHFNALARAFPPVKAVAINAMLHTSFNTQFGIGGVPTVMLFHNGRPAAKFNDSEYTLKMFARFITKYTGLEPVPVMYVESADFGGPVPSTLVRETDYWLGVSWAVILAALGYLVSRFGCWKALTEAVQSAWRDANPHQHSD